MIVIDPSGWLEYFQDGPLATEFAQRLQGRDPILVPAIVLLRHAMVGSDVVPLSSEIAMLAAKMSLQHKLAMADAIIYASAGFHGAEFVTSDRHFKELPNVTYLPKGDA